MKENMMSEEAFNELVNGFEYVATLTKYGRENMKYHIQRLQQENSKYKEVIDKAINDLDIIIDIVREQPFGDRWIINRLEANKNILKEVE